MKGKLEKNNFKHMFISHHNKVAKLLLSTFFSLFHHLTLILFLAARFFLLCLFISIFRFARQHVGKIGLEEFNN
jgi:hypothetical protein